MTRAVLLAAVLLAFASPASAAPDIPDVKTLEELQKVKPIKLGADWEIRLGLSDGGEAAGTWKILYCLAKHARPIDGKAASFKAQINWSEVRNLGPVYFKVVRPDGKEERKVPAGREPKEIVVTAPSEGLYAEVISTAFAGDLRIEVVNDRYERIAERTFTVKDPPIHYWQTFGRSRTIAALPNFGGLRPVWDMTVRQVKWDPETPLPGKVPIPEPWSLEFTEAVGRKIGEPPPPSLLLSLEDGVFVIRATREMLTWPDYYLLARWWVNGRPVPEKMTVPEGDFEEAMGRLLTSGKEMREKFGLPANIGEVKPGDKLALQVLYTPAELDHLRPPNEVHRIMNALRLHEDEHVRVPLLSNRLEFVVTAGMLEPPPAAGKEAAK